MRLVQKFDDAALRHVFLALAACFFLCHPAAAQQTVPATTGVQADVRLEADQQRKEGDNYFADGNVEILYKGMRLRADHVQYNTKTHLATARDHVLLDVDTQHLSADSGDFNIVSGVGHFEHVRGEISMEHRPNPAVLVSPNPLVFEAQEVERLDARTYTIEHTWMTVCEPDKPSWKFFSPEATLHVDQSVVLLNANFRMYRIPLFYFPYASVPAGRKIRQSGFLVPDFSDTSVKGFVLGDAYYWAPKDWTDLTIGMAYLTRRGWQQNGEFRAKPWENVSISARYFGVIDRGIATPVLNAQGMPVTDASGNPVTELESQGGHTAQFKMDALLANGWRAVADVSQLTSLTFQLVFSPTFGEAVNSEVRNAGFLTNNFRGFSADFAAIGYRNFVNAQPQVSEDVRVAPEARFSSVDQPLWNNLPIYFGGSAFVGATHRDDENLVTNPTTGVETVQPGTVTPAFVERSEVAPRVVVPLRWGPWLGVTSSFTARATSYSSRLVGGGVVSAPFLRTTGEVNIDLRPPTIERVWDTGSGKWKHTIDPEIEYNFVDGVDQFSRIILFDEDETLTNTNDFVYSITQRLFRRTGNDQAKELASWKISQAYYFDPTFGGALVPGTRNVFQALDSITPFAFADEPRRFSPIDSDLLITPGGIYDAEIRLDYDTVRQRFTTSEALLKIHPTKNFNFTLAQFSINNPAIPPPHDYVLQPAANQIRTQIGYGSPNRRGWNAEGGVSYDVKQDLFQNEFVEVSYNGSCCGISFEYRRLSLGVIRSENQFRLSLNIANIGTFGNLRGQEKIF
ncbi:MAG TPA: LPS assembly protein LptD [Candidatus Acidoferrales bacterium]